MFIKSHGPVFISSGTVLDLTVNKMMTRKILLLLAVAAPLLVSCENHWRKCPDIKGLLVNGIDYTRLLGNWSLLANPPELGEKCKNVTIEGSSGSYSFHEEYFGTNYIFWEKRYETDYEIVNHEQSSPLLELKNKSWYSFGTDKFAVIELDYDKYLVLYSCSGIFTVTENVWILGRKDVASFNAKTLPAPIKDTLSKLKMSAVDLVYRTEQDCYID